jgi:SynChlorMet cassette protein ScmC
MVIPSGKVAATVSYALSLFDGRPWRLTAFGDARPWLNHLASIMRLKPVSPEADGYRNLLVTRDASVPPWGDLRNFVGPGDVRIAEGAPGGDPHAAAQEVCFYRLNNGDAVLAEIGPEGTAVGEYVKMQHLFAPVFRSLIAEGGFPFHAAVVVREEGAVAFAGSGGAGKSTCARRIPPPWKALCDDLTIIVREPAGSYRAQPFPTWSDYLWERRRSTCDSSTAVPLRAIFFIEQAEREQATPMGQGEASMVINALAAQMYQPHWQAMDIEARRALRLCLFKNAGDAAKVIPAYLLKVALNGTFWRRAEEALGW